MFKNQSKLVKSIRKKHNLTQSDLAKILGVHLQFISNMERGLCGFPAGRFSKIRALVSVDQMMTAARLDFIDSWKNEVGVINK